MPKKDESQKPKPTPEQAALLGELPHRVQTGIAFLQTHKHNSGERFPELEPKHLRVGVNSALVEASAMALLLFRKGIITSEEYFDTLIEVWEAEVDSYQQAIKEIGGRLNI